MPDVINTPIGCEWAVFRGRGEPSCPDATHPYLLACPWCPALENAADQPYAPVGIDT